MINDVQFLANDWQSKLLIVIASLSSSETTISRSVLHYMWKGLENSWNCSDEGIAISWLIPWFTWLHCIHISTVPTLLLTFLIFEKQISQNQNDCYGNPSPLRETCVLCYINRSYLFHIRKSSGANLHQSYHHLSRCLCFYDSIEDKETHKLVFKYSSVEIQRALLSSCSWKMENIALMLVPLRSLVSFCNRDY